MKAPNDAAIDAVQVQGKRPGRPSTGNAMSNAERQRAFRERLRDEIKRAHALLEVEEGINFDQAEIMRQLQLRICELQGELRAAQREADRSRDMLNKQLSK